MSCNCGGTGLDANLEGAPDSYGSDYFKTLMAVAVVLVPTVAFAYWVDSRGTHRAKRSR